MKRVEENISCLVQEWQRRKIHSPPHSTLPSTVQFGKKLLPFAEPDRGRYVSVAHYKAVIWGDQTKDSTRFFQVLGRYVLYLSRHGKNGSLFTVSMRNTPSFTKLQFASAHLDVVFRRLHTLSELQFSPMSNMGHSYRPHKDLASIKWDNAHQGGC